MQIKVSPIADYSLVQFQLEEGEVLAPESLKEIVFPDVEYSKGVVLSGRAPIWLFGAATHHFHPSKWVATHDPRLGYVVVQTHCQEYKVGQVIQPQ